MVVILDDNTLKVLDLDTKYGTFVRSKHYSLKPL